MSKFSQIIIGGIEIAAGIVLDVFSAGTLGNFLIAAGIGTVISGIGTLLSQQGGGLATASRNPVAPWAIVYGRAKVGGTIVYINEFGDDNKYLDLIFVLAAHECESVDHLLFDNQRLFFDSNGSSYSPTQEDILIATITRTNGIVTVVMSTSPTNAFVDGDIVSIENVPGDPTLNGKYPVNVVDPFTFYYVCGGANAAVVSAGHVLTAWADYRAKVYMEVKLGNHTTTFSGMLSGTPYDGDPLDPQTLTPNPWTSAHKILGKCCVFLRLHYNDEVFSSGIPQISFLVHGKNDIYDPRSGTTGYTENSALCIADYLSNDTFGFRATYATEIPIQPLIFAANICDESVLLSAAGFEPRYTCNGVFTTATKRGEVLQNLLTSCAGRLTYVGGQFSIWPAAWNLGGRIGSPIVSGTLSVITSYVPGSYDGFAQAATASIGLTTFTGSGFIYDQSAWSLRTDSLALTADEAAGAVHVLFGIDGALIGTASPPDEFQVYDCWIDVVFANGSTGVMRPTIAQSVTSVTGTVTNAANAIDVNPATHADVDRVLYSSLSTSPFLRLSGFTLYSHSGEVSPASITAVSPMSFAAGPFVWRPKLPIRDVFNGVKATYVSPGNSWQQTDMPPYAQDVLHGFVSDAYLAADGGDRRWLELQLPFTISTTTAQRLAKIELLRRRWQGSGTFAFNMAAYQYTPMDVVAFTVPYLGWTGKYLEIASHRFTLNSQGDGPPVLGTELDLQETDPSIYDWDPSEELTPQGYQAPHFPDTRTVAPPTSPTLTSNTGTASVSSTGVTTSRIQVTWTAPADGYVTNGGQIEVQYQPTGAGSVWTTVGSFSASVTTAYIDGVTDGTSYDVRLRSVNAAGVPSVWVNAGSITASGSALNLHIADNETPGGALDGVNQTYTLAHTPNPTLSLDLKYNGILQLQTVDYSLSGSTITMLVAHPDTSQGDWLRASYRY
jgi:hypothetical protein